MLSFQIHLKPMKLKWDFCSLLVAFLHCPLIPEFTSEILIPPKRLCINSYTFYVHFLYSIYCQTIRVLLVTSWWLAYLIYVHSGFCFLFFIILQNKSQHYTVYTFVRAALVVMFNTKQLFTKSLKQQISVWLYTIKL